MKKSGSILAISLVFFALTGCLKSATTPPCTDKPISTEQPAMSVFAAANGISYTQDLSGLYYQITSPGSGASPIGASRIFVTYTAKLVSNGVAFDTQTNSNLTGWTLNTLIPAWQIGLPLIHKGGTIKLIVPSLLAYGCRGYGGVPPDAPLYFEITLVDIQ
jgi:FKBP-type peptidyl-prolyl cis-trans isomerase FkpA